MEYRIQVNVTTDKDEDTWTGNAVLFNTPEEALEAARDLFMRWTLVRWWRVVDENDKVLHTNKHREGEANEDGMVPDSGDDSSG